MSVLEQQIDKAKVRLKNERPEEWLREAYGKVPVDLNTNADLQARRSFLRESLGDDAKAELAFERIIAGNELQDVAYLARGARAAQAIARIAIREPSGELCGWGSGFLIAPNVLLTNNHVLKDASRAVRSEAHFEFEQDIDGRPLQPVTFSLDPGRLFVTSQPLDFTVVAVTPQAVNSPKLLSSYGYLPLVETLGKVTEGEWLTVIQHPNGERKQICVRENRFIKKSADVLWYSTDTVGGSSGSPVFNNDWYVVALHHSGVPLEKDGRIQTIDGRDFDPGRDGEEKIKWIANEGIRASRIVSGLRQAAPDHPYLQPVYGATPSNSRIGDFATGWRPVIVTTTPAPTPIVVNRRPVEGRPMNPNTAGFPRSVTVTLSIAADGSVSVSSAASAMEAALVLEAAKKKKKPAQIEVPFNSDYSIRKGYSPKFLKGHTVDLPKLSPALVKRAAKLLSDGNEYVLDYHNYSTVVDSKRRFAIYSAANVSFGDRFELTRPTDKWKIDPRIRLEHQIGEFYYKSNKFDRGHLTRYEDLEFGKDVKTALHSAADTCHFTNCVPQHSQFNQNKELWQGIERHILEFAILENEFSAIVFTGPILEEDDPVYDKFPDIQYPVRFWKVVAAINAAKKLFATAYILDQTAVIDQFGIEAAVVPFDAYKTFQVPIAEVTRLTTLTFTADGKSMSEFDPLKEGVPRRRGTGRTRLEESAAAMGAPSGYLPIDSLEAIRTTVE